MVKVVVYKCEKCEKTIENAHIDSENAPPKLGLCVFCRGGYLVKQEEEENG